MESTFTIKINSIYEIKNLAKILKSITRKAILVKWVFALGYACIV